MDRMPESEDDLISEIINVGRKNGEEPFRSDNAPQGMAERAFTMKELGEAIDQLPEIGDGDTFGPWIYCEDKNYLQLDCSSYVYWVDLGRVEEDGLADWVLHLSRKQWRYLDRDDWLRCFVYACHRLCDRDKLISS